MRKILPIALALLAIPTLAQALDLYVGGGLASDVTAGRLANDPAFDHAGTDSTGDRYKFFAGFDLGRRLTVEASYLDLGSQRCCTDVTDLAFDSSTTGYSAALLARWPIGRFAVYGKVGAMRWREDATLITFGGPSDASDSGTDPLYGAGATFGVTDHFALRAEWERYDFGGESADGVWAAAQYRF